MDIIVFGASGGIGSEVVRQAAERGHDVTAVVREGSTWRAPEAVTTPVGEATDAAFVRGAVDGHEVVLSCLGLRRAGRAPWAELLSPPNLVEQCTGHLLAGVRDRPDVHRIVWVSAGGVGDSLDACTWAVRRMTRTANVGVAYEDLERAEARIDEEGDDRWLAVRPVTLTDGRHAGGAREVARYGLLSTVSRADVAHWMLDAAEGRTAEGRRAVLLGR